jgi:hypothetical protein
MNNGPVSINRLMTPEKTAAKKNALRALVNPLVARARAAFDLANGTPPTYLPVKLLNVATLD